MHLWVLDAQRGPGFLGYALSVSTGGFMGAVPAFRAGYTERPNVNIVFR